MRQEQAANLALLCHADGELREVVAGGLAAHEVLHRAVVDAVHVERQGPHCRAHHAIPVSDELCGLRVQREGLLLLLDLEEELHRQQILRKDGGRLS